MLKRYGVSGNNRPSRKNQPTDSLRSHCCFTLWFFVEGYVAKPPKGLFAALPAPVPPTKAWYRARALLTPVFSDRDKGRSGSLSAFGRSMLLTLRGKEGLAPDAFQGGRTSHFVECGPRAQ